MSGHLYPNNHSLYRKTEPGTEPYWRIAHLAELSAGLGDDEKAVWEDVSTSDYPNGLIHDESCRACKGTGLMSVTVLTGYWCTGCGMEGEYELFTSSTCLQLGAGYYEELRAQAGVE